MRHEVGIAVETEEVRAEREFQEISLLVPSRGIPVEERKILNAQIRSKLSVAGDLTLVYLIAAGHQLSREEFLKRLRDETSVVSFGAMFVWADKALHMGIVSGNRKILEQIDLKIKRNSGAILQAEVAEIFYEYVGSIVERDSYLLETVLNHRPDRQELYEIMKQKAVSGQRPARMRCQPEEFLLRLEGIRERANSLSKHGI